MSANLLKIMPVGDSITEGTVPGGYRARLYTLLTLDGYDVNFVGDQTSNPGGGLPSNQENHEGIGGDTSVDLRRQIDSSGILQSSQPHVILLLVGTNDIGPGASQATADANIAALIDDMIAKDPTVHIFLSNVLHRADDGSGWVTALNASLPAIVASRADHVSMVDMASALTLADLDSGGLHPSQAGYNKMAAVWDTAIKSYFGTPVSGLAVRDAVTNQPLPAVGQPYSGPVPGPTSEYISISAASLNISVTTPNWFIKSAGGDNVISVTSGDNVLDGGTGSNFLIGGTGADIFYIDVRGAAHNSWSSVVNFHSGDNATIWGITPADFSITWLADQGAAGSVGLTGVFVSNAVGKPETAITLAGYTPADLTNGRLSISYGTTAGLPNMPGSSYMTIHGT